MFQEKYESTPIGQKFTVHVPAEVEASQIMAASAEQLASSGCIEILERKVEQQTGHRLTVFIRALKLR